MDGYVTCAKESIKGLCAFASKRGATGFWLRRRAHPVVRDAAVPRSISMFSRVLGVPAPEEALPLRLGLAPFWRRCGLLALGLRARSDGDVNRWRRSLPLGLRLLVRRCQLLGLGPALALPDHNALRAASQLLRRHPSVWCGQRARFGCLVELGNDTMERRARATTTPINSG